VLYSQRAWNQREREGRAESSYSAARSESPSEYSRRAWDSTASLDEGFIQSRPESLTPSTNTRDQLEESTYDSMDTINSDDHHPPNASQLQPRMSVLGPKTRFVTRAPWEPGGEDDVQEEEDQDIPEAETRSLFGGRGRAKKSKDPKVRQFPPSFAPRASSSSRPSVDIPTPTSSSSGGRFRQTGRPGSAGTSHSNGSEALPFPSPRYERPVAASPRHVYRDIPEQESMSHPYANPDHSSIYEDRTSTNEAISPSSVHLPHPPLAVKPPSSDHISHTSHLSPSAPSREIPRTPTLPQQRDVPQKMAPWQYTPSSPTFQLVSLEEAQALKARQRQMSFGTAEPVPRMRTVSGPNRKSILPVEHANAAGNSEDAHPGKTLKGRRSLMGLFARGKESRSRPDSPPPVPVLSHHPSPVSGSTSPLPTMQTPTTTSPLRQETHPQTKAPRRVPPPALNVVVTSPQPQSRRQDSEPLGPPPAIPLIQKSATPPPSFPSRAPVRKQNSTATLSPTEGLSPGKPSSAPSSIQGFTGLSLRPVSTMFSSMPVDYLSNLTPAPPAPSFMSASNSAGQFSTQSPTTPSLWSSRSESMSTGSSEMPPFTSGGGLVHSIGSTSSSMDGGAQSMSHLQRQVQASREVWKGQITDLEAQVRALKAEVADLRQSPCPSCGHFGGGSSCMEKTSVVNRPRAKTAAGTNRTLFGNAD
jgi:hypothetical protein